jgi:hypothetical protein
LAIVPTSEPSGGPPTGGRTIVVRRELSLSGPVIGAVVIEKDVSVPLSVEHSPHGLVSQASLDEIIEQALA